MLVASRHHCPPSVYGPKSAPKAMACSGVGLRAEAPRTTMTTKTNTLMAISERGTGNESAERRPGDGGSGARMVGPRCSSHAGQFRVEGEAAKLRSNSLPHVAQRSKGMRGEG